MTESEQETKQDTKQETQVTTKKKPQKTTPWGKIVGVIVAGLIVLAIIAGTNSGSSKRDFSQNEMATLDNVQYSITKVEETTETFDDGIDLTKEEELEPGYKYLNVTVRIKNLGDEEVSYSNSNFFLIDGQANFINQKTYIYIDDVHLSAGKLGPDESIERIVSWKVKDGTKGLRVRFYKNYLMPKVDEYDIQWSISK